MKSPTRSQISAPSKLPIVTSKVEALDFFVHGCPLLKSRDFRACLIIVMSLSEIGVNCLAQEIAWSSSSSEIDG